jgi:hypothetical protein
MRVGTIQSGSARRKTNTFAPEDANVFKQYVR